MQIETPGRTKLELHDMLLFHTDSRNHEIKKHWVRDWSSKKCYYFIHNRQIMSISRAALPELDLWEVLLFHTDTRNHGNQKHWARGWNSKKCYHFTHNRQIMSIDRAALPQLDLWGVLLFHTELRDYDNQSPGVPEAGNPRNATISHIFAELWQSAKRPKLEFQEMLPFYIYSPGHENQNACASYTESVRSV